MCKDASAVIGMWNSNKLALHVVATHLLAYNVLQAPSRLTALVHILSMMLD